MPLWISLLNSIAGIASAGFGVIALTRPALLSPGRAHSAQSRFFPAMYAGRAIPLGIAVSIAVWITPSTSTTILLIIVALLAQIADLTLGLTHCLPGMIAGASFAIICHGIAVVALV